jgi:hypothetical protein
MSRLVGAHLNAMHAQTAAARNMHRLLAPSEDDGAREVFLKVFGGPPGPSPESLLPNIKTPVRALSKAPVANV